MAKKSKPKNPVPDSRDERLKMALKANMAKRKAQAKARAEPGKGQEQNDG